MTFIEQNAASGKTQEPATRTEIYLVSALVENKSGIGHRAYVGHWSSKTEAIGVALDSWQKDGWSVRSHDCVRCDNLTTSARERQAVDILRRLYPIVEDMDDEGPWGERWQSDEFKRALADAKTLLEADEAAS